MKLRSPAAPLLLPLITLGIYSLVWYVKTKNEMNRTNGSDKRIPSAWLLIVPIANIVWLWKYSVGVEAFTRNGLGRHATFWILFLLGSIGAAIVQSFFNSAIRTPAAAELQPATA